MAGIDDLITTFLGQAQQGLNAPPAPWQQELLETVNPAKVKRQNIARALAQASTAMATTPGNFLSGVSAAAATGANSYLTGKEQADEQRIKVQQLVQMAQQKDQDRRLSLLMDAIGVSRNQIKDRQDAAESDARVGYFNRRGTGANNGLSAAQVQTNRRTARREIQLEQKRLQEQVNSGVITPEEMQQQLDAFTIDTNEYYGVEDSNSGADPGNISQSDLWSPSPGQRQPGSAEVLTPDQYESGIPQPRQSQGILQPPPAAIDFLRKNPQHRAQFDAKYGQGAAAAILGK